MLLFFGSALKDWATGRYKLGGFDRNSQDHVSAAVDFQPDETLAEIVERTSLSSQEILEEFGLSWFDEFVPKRFAWQLEVLGLLRSNLSLGEFIANTGAFLTSIESFNTLFSSATAPAEFWWNNLKKDTHLGEECESAVLHYRESKDSHINMLPFYVGVIKYAGKLQQKNVVVKYLKGLEETSQEVYVEWKSINSDTVLLYSPASPSMSPKSARELAYGLEPNELCELFPFHMILRGENDPSVVQAGDGLVAVIPTIVGQKLRAHTSNITCRSIYGETTTIDSENTPSNWELADKQVMILSFQNARLCLKGKITAKKRNGETLFFYFGKPIIPSTRYHHPERLTSAFGALSLSNIISPICFDSSPSISPSSPPSPMAFANDYAGVMPLQSSSSVPKMTTGPALGLSMETTNTLGIMHESIVEEMLLQDIAKHFVAVASKKGINKKVIEHSKKKKEKRKFAKKLRKSRSPSPHKKSHVSLDIPTPVQRQLMEVNKALSAEIAEKKQLQLQLESAKNEASAESRATSAFLAHMSHEIRTPLNGILGMSQLLLESALDSQQRDTADTIQTSGQQLLTIVNDILDFEKIQAGCLTLEFISFDLRKVIEECCDMLSFQSNTKQLELVIFFSRQVPRFVKGDPGRLRQVLLNFLNNAIKFTEAGHIRVVVTCKPPNAGDESVDINITIEDTGIGIPEDRLGRLFKSFSQVDSSIARKYGGTGLGLVISKQLVELMGGSPITVKSKVNEGSSFSFTLPLKLDTEVVEKKPSLHTYTFLVAEHNEVLRSALVEDLQAMGAEVVTATTVSEAEEAMRKAIISLIFSSTDLVKLPSWLEFFEAVCKKTPVVMSCSPFSRAREELASKSFTMLSKPTKRHELEYLVFSELGLLSTEAQETIRGRRRKSIKLSRKFSMGTYCVLLVDDNPINLKVASRLLERLCLKPDCVCSGHEAIECVRRKNYDVILMDLQMPGMNGYETTHELRNLEKADSNRKPCKVVAITADATTDDRSKCLQSGMDDFISKPLTLEKLADVLDRILFGDSDSPLPVSVEAELLAKIPAHDVM